MPRKAADRPIEYNDSVVWDRIHIRFIYRDKAKDLNPETSRDLPSFLKMTRWKHLGSDLESEDLETTINEFLAAQTSGSKWTFFYYEKTLWALGRHIQKMKSVFIAVTSVQVRYLLFDQPKVMKTPLINRVAP